MKKTNLIITLSFLVNIILIVDMLNFHVVDTAFAKMKNALFAKEKTSTTTDTSPPKKVAIMVPISHPSLEKIEQGFRNTLNSLISKPIEYTVYNGNGTRTLMRSQIEEVVSSDTDLIFTVGASCSQLAKETTSKKSADKPIVFAAVSNPEKLNLISHELKAEHNVTGAIEVRNHQLQLNLLMLLKPETKKVLLAYNPAQDPQLERDKEEIAQILSEKNVELKSIEVYQPNEILQKVAPEVSQADVLLILKDNTMVSSMDALVKLCDRYDVTIYTSDLDSSAKGASFAFGVEEESFGIVAAKKAYQILDQGISAGLVASSPVQDFRLQFNQDAFKGQNVELDPNLWFLAHNSILYGKGT